MSHGQSYPPAFEGQICVYPSPDAEDVWLVDKAAYDARRSLRWSELDYSNPICRAAIDAYLRCREATRHGMAHPEIRSLTIHMWAANLAARHVARGDLRAADASHHAALAMTTGSGEMAFSMAIAAGVEANFPLQAEVERMLTTATRQNIRGALPTLRALRAGIDPSGRMFTRDEQITALQLQFPELAADANRERAQHDNTTSATASSST